MGRKTQDLPRLPTTVHHRLGTSPLHATKSNNLQPQDSCRFSSTENGGRSTSRPRDPEAARELPIDYLAISAGSMRVLNVALGNLVLGSKRKGIATLGDLDCLARPLGGDACALCGDTSLREGVVLSVVQKYSESIFCATASFFDLRPNVSN